MASYQDLVSGGRLQEDPTQLAAVDVLAELQSRLLLGGAATHDGSAAPAPPHAMPTEVLEAARQQQVSHPAQYSTFEQPPQPGQVQDSGTSAGGGGGKVAAQPEGEQEMPLEAIAAVAGGAYLWGRVGSGKSMLMDLFYERSRGLQPLQGEGAMLRMHFHEFMLEVHKEMHRLQEAQEVRVVKMPATGLQVYKRTPLPRHPVVMAAESFAKQRCHSLLCLDEMQVTDVADAMILRRLFAALMGQGVSVVFTSNVPPEGLYSDPYLARSREYFLPFVELVYSTCTVQLVGGHAPDYRALPAPDDAIANTFGHLVKTTKPGGFFSTDNALEDLWQRTTLDAAQVGPSTLPVEFGRLLEAPRTASGLALDTEEDDEAARLGVAWFDFEGLCSRQRDGSALGAADFLALSSAFSQVFVAGLRPLTSSQRDEARRLVILIDTLYERRVQLFCAAACEPKAIFAAIARLEDCKMEEKLSYMRATSRLQEMRRSQDLVG